MFGRFPVLLFRLGFGCLFLSLSSLSVSWGAGSSSFTLPSAPVLSSADVYGPVEGAPATLSCRFGQLCARRLGDGDTIDYGYDPDSAGGLRGEPTRMWLTGADEEPLAEQSFVYDAAGEMTGRTMRYADGSGFRWHYAYDNERRLIGATKTDVVSGFREVLGYGYDGNGNMTSELSGASTTLRRYDGLDRLKGRVYGARGESLVDGRGARYGYDDRGRTSGWTTGDGTHVDLRRWPNGTRAEKVSSGRVLHYFNDARGRLLAVVSGDGTSSHYAYAGGLIGRAVTGGDTALARYYFTDHAGSVLSETDGDGAIVSKRSYGPYGARGGGSTDGFDLSQNAIGFHGRYEDAGTGNLMYPSRLYGGGGRFTTQDAESTPNLYRAYNDDPVGHGDDGGYMAYSLLGHMAPKLTGETEPQEDEAQDTGELPESDEQTPGVQTIGNDENLTASKSRKKRDAGILWGVGTALSGVSQVVMAYSVQQYNLAREGIGNTRMGTTKAKNLKFRKEYDAMEDTYYTNPMDPSYRKVQEALDKAQKKFLLPFRIFSFLALVGMSLQFIGSAMVAEDGKKQGWNLGIGISMLVMSFFASTGGGECARYFGKYIPFMSLPNTIGLAIAADNWPLSLLALPMGALFFGGYQGGTRYAMKRWRLQRPDLMQDKNLMPVIPNETL